MTRTTTPATLAGALALLVLAGCGGDKSGTSSTPNTTTIDPTRVLDPEGYEWSFGNYEPGGA